MLQCADNTLYTGITTDLSRRVREHNGARAARYTRARQPVQLVYAETVANRSLASKREWALKQLPRAAKLQLIQEAASLDGQ